MENPILAKQQIFKKKTKNNELDLTQLNEPTTWLLTFSNNVFMLSSSSKAKQGNFSPNETNKPKFHKDWSKGVIHLRFDFVVKTFLLYVDRVVFWIILDFVSQKRNFQVLSSFSNQLSRTILLMDYGSRQLANPLNGTIDSLDRLQTKSSLVYFEIRILEIKTPLLLSSDILICFEDISKMR